MVFIFNRNEKNSWVYFALRCLAFYYLLLDGSPNYQTNIESGGWFGKWGRDASRCVVLDLRGVKRDAGLAAGEIWLPRRLEGKMKKYEREEKYGRGGVWID